MRRQETDGGAWLLEDIHKVGMCKEGNDLVLVHLDFSVSKNC